MGSENENKVLEKIFPPPSFKCNYFTSPEGAERSLERSVQLESAQEH